MLAYATYVAGVALATWPLARHPASLWADHTDPPLFTWVMASMARWVAAGPWRLFDGSAFYPYGKSLAFSEPLLLPALVGFPGFVWGSPALTYNLLILLLWPVNGVAMAWAAWEVTGSRLGAWLAGAVFCLSPYFVQYHLEFNMLPAAPVPVALVAWVRWLERQQVRWLVLALGAFTAQGLTCWYYTVATGLGFLTLTIGFLCLRWRGWRWWRDGRALLIGGLAVAVALAPVALPYFIVKRELGLERHLSDVRHSDLLNFFEPVSRFESLRVPWSRRPSETSPFAGFSIMALGALALARGWRDGRPGPGGPRWLARSAGLTLVLAVAGIVLTIAHGRSWHSRVGGFGHSVGVGSFVWLVLATLVGLLLARGWSASRARAPRPLRAGDWAWLFALLTAVAMMLVVGPSVRVAGGSVGVGPYNDLYRVLFPLHAVRITVRFAILSLPAMGLLAALGWRELEARLSSPSLRWLCFACVAILLALEYAPIPIALAEVKAPRPVDLVLQADPADVAVLEWPTNSPLVDADAMFRSLYHGKRVVNGFSGFSLASLGDLSALLTIKGPPFPAVEAQAALRQIHPLRYLLVRWTVVPDFRASWLGVREAPPPILHFRGTYGDVDLYDVLTEPDEGVHLERYVSGGFLLGHPDLEIEVASRGAANALGAEPFVDVRLNGNIVGRVALVGQGMTLRTHLHESVLRAAPNVFTLDYGYVWPLERIDARHRIGATGVLSPKDLHLQSLGGPGPQPRSRIELDGVDLSLSHRGYNLVALGVDGRILGATAFDTFALTDASAGLANWIGALPTGTIVAGAVADEASRFLGADAVAALRSLGSVGDLRGRFRAAHVFVGVKGAAPGTAAEALDSERAELQIGDPPRDQGLTLRRFALRS
jgi:hypothetical protein